MKVPSALARLKNFAAPLLLCLILVGPSAMTQETSGDQIVLVGLDAMKHSVSHKIPAEDYSRNLTLAFGSVNDSLLPVLEEHQAVAPNQSRGWHLNAVGIGIGISGSVGLGPIINITSAAQIRLVFTNSKKPIYPN
jgi:hypothetical protein